MSYIVAGVIIFSLQEDGKDFSGEIFGRTAAIHTADAARKLEMLDAAETLEDLRSPPGNRLEVLRDDRAGRHSIRINDQWRICFVWRENNAHDVEIVDCH
ncbi:MAG TPA: type II toxin-antitoxin system RelE/ParE family toxin [Syntrophales bacterium]|nr:type II toxin-antitoxin system RelE/ParE family toxin [Syntrophales bacterium]